MEYKGYIGLVAYDDQAKIFHGDVINTRDVITFQGTSVDEIEKAFQDSVEDYLVWCEKDGVDPEKPYSGKFNLRLSPKLHKEVAVTAKKMNMSINSFVEKALLDEINQNRAM
ncbi:MAG: type II toxin-antitoxin system HicB family antitoxin [Rectinemataceae bacterium]